MVLPPLAIVWRCPLSVEQYLERGRQIEVPRHRCPDCEAPLRFRSGYWRHVRSGVTGRRAWVRRAQCVGCRRSHALLPSFLLQGRLDVVGSIGAVVAAVVDGTVTSAVAKAAHVPYTTARDWLRRLRARAPTLAAGLVAIAVEVGAEAGLAALGVDATRRVLDALRLVAQAVGSSLSLWSLASLITGGTLLGTTTNPPWTLPGGRRVMPPVP